MFLSISPFQGNILFLDIQKTSKNLFFHVIRGYGKGTFARHGSNIIDIPESIEIGLALI